MQPKGVKSKFNHTENRDTEGEGENDSNMSTENVLFCAGVAAALEISTEETMIKCGEIILSNYMITYGIGDEDKINNFIHWISVRRPDLLQQLYPGNNSSAEEVEQALEKIFDEIAIAQDEQMTELYDRYKLIITINDVNSLQFTENNIKYTLNDVQKVTFVKCWNMLVGMGLSLEQIIGVMANIYDEGRLCPTNAEDGMAITTKNGEITLPIGNIDDSAIYVFCVNDGVGYGACQWTYVTRKEGLLQMALDMDGDVSDLDVQLAFLKYEMENWSQTDTKMEGYSLDDFLTVNTVEDAVVEFMIHFENPNLDPAKRIDFAQDIEQWYNSI